MNYIHEEEKLKGIYDIKLFKNLLRYLKPYWFALSFVFFLLLISSILDILLPYITKIAIDRYIVPPYRILNFEKKPELKKDFLKKYKGKIKEDIIIKKEDLDEGDYIFYEKNGIIGKESYILIKKDKKILKKIPYIQIGETILISYDNLKKLHPGIIANLRSEDIQGIKILTFVYIILLIFSGLIAYLHMIILQLIGQKVMLDARGELFSHILRLPMKFFDKNPVGRTVTRVTNDINALNEFFTSVLVNLLKDIVLIIGLIVVMIKMSFLITLLILLLSPIIIIATNIFRVKVREAYREVRRKLALLNAFLQESLSGISIIHIYNQEKKIEKQFDNINENFFLANMKQIIVFAIFRPIIDIVGSLAIALLLLSGGWSITRAGFTLGAFVAFISYIQMLFRPIMDLSEKYNIFQSAMAASERIHILQNEKEEEKGNGKISLNKKGEVIFQDVWLRYDEEKWVLKGVSFKVSPFEKVAIVGPTGAGKTSIINALLGFYPVQKGKILVNGIDIKEWDLYKLRKRIGLVLQDVFIFAGDFLTNIRLREENFSMDKVKDAVQRVYANTFIEKKENGYYEEVSERGATLSTGQKQLLSFARALCFDPEILILDEATSSVDSYTEHLIQKGLKELLKERTSIIIAHRLSTIQDADKIIVLFNGKVIEEGNHQELLAKKGLYAKLWKIQAGTEFFVV